MTAATSELIESVPQLIDQARARRAAALRRARLRSLAMATTVIVAWAAAILATGQADRVVANASAAATMVFGSFVAGSTPQGGGAVAFPVFTKVLGVSAADARTFSLCIQAVGMGSASIIIAITGRPVDRSALRLTIPSAVAGFLAGSALFALVTPPSAYLKVIFTLFVVAAGGATWLTRRPPVVEHLLAAPLDRREIRGWVVVVSLFGGMASSLFGSGVDVAVYLLLTIVLGLRPNIGVATSVVTMAAVSVVGLAAALLSGQLAVSSDAVVGTDVFGMWLAAVPVVVVGAPIGSWFASRASASTLARFIGALAIVELVSTIVFLDELRTSTGLLAMLVCGLVVTAVGVLHTVQLRDRIAASRGFHSTSVRRLDLEFGAAR